jgi:NitT/TauT family transport system substrate-binding protein
LILGACSASDGSGEETVELVPVLLTNNYLVGGASSGFALAIERGYYEEVGLDVTFEESQGSAATVGLVDQGKSEFGYADGPTTMQAAAKGADVLIVAPVLQTNGYSVISLEENGITEVADLVGKKVGLAPGTSLALLFEVLLAANDVDPADVDIINLDPSALVGSLLQGSVDAIVGGADNQSVNARDLGGNVTDIFFKDAGVPTVGLSIIVQGAWAAEHPDLVTAFIEASMRGWDDARNEPEKAAAATYDQFPVAGSQGAFLKQLRVDQALFCANGAESLGKLPAENWDITFEILVESLDLPDANPVSAYYTEDYLPEELPAC